MLKRFGKYSVWIMAFLFVTGIIIVYKSIDNFSSVKMFFSEIIGVLSPFIIGFVIAFLLNSPVKKISKWFEKSKIKFVKKNHNGLAVLSIYVIAIILLTLVLRLIIPPLCRNIVDLYQSMPVFINRAIEFIEKLIADGVIPPLDTKKLMSLIPVNDLFSVIDIGVITKYAQGVMGITSNVIDVFIGIIVSIYMLLGKHRIFEALFKFIRAYFSEKTEKKARIAIKNVNKVFSKFISCQLIDAVIVATLASIVLNILNVKYALVLGAMVGIFNLIPYFGAIIACVIAIVITIFTGGFLQALWTAIALVVIQQIDSNIIGPNIMGENLDISPLLIIFAVTVGGGLFGVVGMLVSVPVVAIIKEFIVSRIRRRLAQTEPESEPIKEEGTKENG